MSTLTDAVLLAADREAQTMQSRAAGKSFLILIAYIFRRFIPTSKLSIFPNKGKRLGGNLKKCQNVGTINSKGRFFAVPCCLKCLFSGQLMTVLGDLAQIYALGNNLNNVEGTYGRGVIQYKTDTEVIVLVGILVVVGQDFTQTV